MNMNMFLGTCIEKISEGLHTRLLRVGRKVGRKGKKYISVLKFFIISIEYFCYFKKQVSGTSLQAHWLRVCPPMQGHRFEPWSGKIPVAMGQQKTHVPQLLKPTHSRGRAQQQEKPQQWEALTSLLRSSPCSQRLEKTFTETKTQCS